MSSFANTYTGHHRQRRMNFQPRHLASAVVAMSGALAASGVGGHLLGPQPEAAKHVATHAAPDACPAPDPVLVARYASQQQLGNGNITTLHTKDAVAGIEHARDAQTILARTNAALRGSITVRLATAQDEARPLANRYDRDQPRAVTATSIPLPLLRQTTEGILDAYDNMPADVGTLHGKPLSVVITDGFITADGDTRLDGESYVTDDVIALKAGQRSNLKASTLHETGHNISAAAIDPTSDCYYNDPAVRRPRNLTRYALGSQGTKEIIADDFALQQGAHFADVSPQALQDPDAAYDFSVLLAELATAGHQSVADGLHNRALLTSSGAIS